jgi:hypothetical protein
MPRKPGSNFSVNIGAIGTLMAAAFLMLCLGSSVASAQILYGSITGTVTDKSGAVVPDVTVTMTNQGTGEVRSATANGSGNYNILDVLPGNYSISIPASGSFAAFTENNIQIEINRQVRVDIALRLARVASQITVTDAPPALQTESGEVNAEISQTELSQLPITSSQGRNFQALYTVIPGAAAVVEQNSTGSNPSRAMSVNMNGVSMNGNTTRIDGAVNYYGWLEYLIAYVPPSDSIENVSFTTNSFNAEQGQAGGSSVKITTKSGTRDLHGGAWEYYQDAAFNAQAYTNAVGSVVPKNIFDQFGFNLGGPVYLPRILTGRKKLFFFDNFERTTRRQLVSGNVSVPTTNMLTGDFSQVSSITTLYDPQPVVPDPVAAHYVNGYLLPAYRTTTFQSEYGCNCIPIARQSVPAQKMLALLQPISAEVGAAGQNPESFTSDLANDVYGFSTFSYNRNTNDVKINYLPNDNTQIFGKYSIEPFTVDDAQQLLAAGGGTYDGGQPGAAAGRIQNVGLGASHVFAPNLVVDTDFGYTRQVTGAQSTLDLSLGDYGSGALGIPGTNGPAGDTDYYGQPVFSFAGPSGTNFNSLGNSNGANPFHFRENQFTGDVNLSWVKGKHTTKYGFTYYHFDLNHFQPTTGSGITGNPRGGFQFSGGMTCTAASCPATNYNALADFLLGLPNAGTGTGVSKSAQLADPNSLRWTELGAYAQDEWAITPKLTLDYGVRWEYYPAPYRDHSGVYILDPTLPQSANVEIGGVLGNPKNAGLDMGHGMFVPRVGFAYRLNEKTVIRTGGGLTTDPDNLRFLRDTFPEDLSVNYTGSATGTVPTDPANANAPMTLAPGKIYGIPVVPTPNLTTGFVSLPVAGGTNTAPKNFRRGYLESWNLFIQRDLGHQLVANVGYVGNHFVRQMAGVSPYNAAPLPSASTPCMADGQWNPSSGLTGGCNFNANEIINQKYCSGTSNPVCYNTGGITMNEPEFSSEYNGLQTQLTRSAGRNASFGVIYTWSHAMDFEDNGAGTGASGTTFNYPAYFYLNRASATYNRKHNAQVWGIYSLPFGYGQKYADHGPLAQIIGGFNLNGQFSHISGAPFSVTANGTTYNAPGMGAAYAELVAPYQQLGGHARVNSTTNPVSSGKPWFAASSFQSIIEPPATVAGNPTNASPTLPNTHRNEFRGPGQSVFNASLFRSFHIYRESEFQIRFEAFNVFNHALLNNPNTGASTNANDTAGGTAVGTFGYITSFGNARSLQFGGRFNF